MISESNAPNKAWLIRPKLRPVEALPARSGDRPVIALRDPSRISLQVLFLAPAAVHVLRLMDGSNDFKDIQAAIMTSFGQMIDLDSIGQLVQILDENHFLEGDTFESHLARTREEFAVLSVRPARMAGQAYPGDPRELTAFLDSFYTHPNGPGLSEAPSTAALPQDTPRGLVAPHIDYQRGGPCYAWLYRCLEVENPPPLVIILGTAHSPIKHPLVPCAKDFETPLGPAKCQKEFIEDFSSRLTHSTDEDELVHSNEHSIELQAVWLRKLYPGGDDLHIVPILVGSFLPLIMDGITPEQSREYEHSLAALKAAMDRWIDENGSVLILSSADLSHVGPQFGDSFRIDDEVQRDIRQKDLTLLEAATEGDYREFFQMVADRNDQTNVCGFSSIYTMLRLLGNTRGQLLAYDQWIDENGEGLVSFAGLRFD